jgi:RNA polymerase sigma-70 factor, ECF subfamily
MAGPAGLACDDHRSIRGIPHLILRPRTAAGQQHAGERDQPVKARKDHGRYRESRAISFDIPISTDASTTECGQAGFPHPASQTRNDGIKPGLQRMIGMTGWSEQDVAVQLPALRRYARALTHDAIAADDLVQQALLRAWTRAETFRNGGSLRAWLFAILHNEFVSGLRRQRAEARAISSLSMDQVEEGEAGHEFGLRLAETGRRIAQLPAAQRAVLHLIAVEGMSYQQAAHTLSVPIGTVMSRLGRARAALRAAPNSERTLRIIGGKDAS